MSWYILFYLLQHVFDNIELILILNIELEIASLYCITAYVKVSVQTQLLSMIIVQIVELLVCF